MSRSRVLVSARVAASAERAFDAFTEEIGRWWRPNELFWFTDQVGTLAFVPGPAGRLVERYDDGTEFVVGEILEWDPPRGLRLTWRQAGFTDEQSTELRVRFDEVGDLQTRVTVEHFGWDQIPQDHVARHGFPLDAIQRRYGEWWQQLLDGLI